MKHEFNPMSAAELLSEDNLRPPKHGQRWGNWTYDSHYLTHQSPHYDIGLELCVDAATTWAWVLQVADKSWSTTDDIGNLVRALGRLVGHRLR